MKQAGLNKDQCADIYGVDARTMNSIDMEFYYPAEHMRDPLGTGADYDYEDITTMLLDLEETSQQTGFTYDPKGVLNSEVTFGSDEPMFREETIYNVAVAECLRGVVFNEIGDIINICIRYRSGTDNPDGISKLNNIAQDSKHCLRKVKARVVATSKKIPGFYKFSGYKQFNPLCPDVFMSLKQLRRLVNETIGHFPKEQEKFIRQVTQEQLPSSHDLPKAKLYVRMADGVSREARNIFKNDLLNHINDEQIFIFDSFSFSSDIQARMIILHILNSIISFICYIMGLFQLILTIQANIRDSQWELGVLRSMGMNKGAVMRLTVYETLANNLASIVCGFAIGLMVAVGSIG